MTATATLDDHRVDLTPPNRPQHLFRFDQARAQGFDLIVRISVVRQHRLIQRRHAL
jgi:hypothetical protein